MKAAVALVLFPIATAAVVWLFFRLTARSTGRHRLARVIIGNVLVFGVLCSVGVTVGEAYYRYGHDTTDAFSASKGSKRWFTQYWTLNNVGIRDNVEYESAIQHGKRRVTFIGDSFTAAHGVKNVDDRFANLIRRAHPDWEVHLIADSGWDTGEHLLMLNVAVARGEQLDEVVLVYMLNDVADLIPEWTQTIKRILGDAEHRPWLLEHSYLASRVSQVITFYREPDVRNYFQFVRAAYSGPRWQRQVQRLDSLRKQVERAGGHLSVVTFPFLNHLGPAYEYRAIHRQLDTYWTERGVPHLDLLGVYDSIPSSRIVVNRYDAHPNEYAHALAARTIDTFLQLHMVNSAAHLPGRAPSRSRQASGRR